MDWMAQAAGYWTPRYLTFKHALELGGHVRKGERSTKVYFVKQSEIHEDADNDSPTRLDGVDSRDSLLGANQIQGCFWGGSLGCDGPVGFERRGVGADGAADHRPA
jgi:hypothetical protein